MSKNTSNMLFETCWTPCKKPHFSTWSRSRYTFFWMTRYVLAYFQETGSVYLVRWSFRLIGLSIGPSVGPSHTRWISKKWDLQTDTEQNNIMNIERRSSEDEWTWLYKFKTQNCSVLDRGRSRKAWWRNRVLSQIPPRTLADRVSLPRCRENSAPGKYRRLQQRLSHCLRLYEGGCHAYPKGF